MIGVPVDEDGLDVDALERLLARHEVKLVALQTACQNPTGRNISEERRERIAQLAMERNFFVLEDRVYADSSFEGEPPRPMRELAPAHVIYVNSLSKSVGGGLRAGWVAARGPVRERIAMLKLENDFHSPTLIQHMAARWLAAGAHDRHVKKTLPFYRERRDALLAALERHLPGEYRVDVPTGGHHLWVILKRPVDERGALLGIRPPGRDVHARRSGDRRAPVADRDAPVLLPARSTRARRGRAAPGAGDPRGAPSQPHGGGRADVVSPRGAPTSRPAGAAPRANSDSGRVAGRRRDECAGRRRKSSPGRRDLGEVAARVVLTLDALEQPVPLEPVNQPGEAAAADQHRIGQLGHAHAAFRGVGQEQQDLVGRQRQAVRPGQLGIEPLRELGVDAQHPAPCRQLLGVEDSAGSRRWIVARGIQIAR